MIIPLGLGSFGRAMVPARAIGRRLLVHWLFEARGNIWRWCMTPCASARRSSWTENPLKLRIHWWHLT
jgi:hypothetical protein